MRPVLTWKSTAAAPTPIRLGAWVPPSALRPWHDEQPARKRARPSRTCSLLAAEPAARPLGAKAAHRKPITIRPRTMTIPAGILRFWRGERARLPALPGLADALAFLPRCPEGAASAEETAEVTSLASRVIGGDRWSRTGPPKRRRRSASSTRR